ncbi:MULTISPECIES: AlpA family phage regulatory protein [Spongiibacter]|uniref:AlpA family phage regulatory protein n=1 Tax=Spongiibacter TaxID=630749 RepID=UPI0035BE2AB5
MSAPVCFELARRPQAEAIDSLKPSTRCALMAEGTYPKNFTITGSRTVAWLKADILAWCAARAAGASNDEIKELVKELDEARQNIDWRSMIKGGGPQGRI